MTERARKEYMDYCIIVNSAKEEGRIEAKLEAARNFILANIDLNIIAQCTSLPLETVQQLAEELKNEVPAN